MSGRHEAPAQASCRIITVLEALNSFYASVPRNVRMLELRTYLL